MKKKNLIFVIIAGLVLLASCKEKLEVPTGGFDYYTAEDFAYKAENPNPPVIYVGQAINFVSSSNDAEYYSVWPGSNGYNYELRNLPEGTAQDANYVASKNIGLAVKYVDGVAQSNSFKYTTVGEFKVAFVSRNVLDGGLEYEENVTYKTITVADTIVDLFPAPGVDGGNYKFYVSAPKAIKNVYPTINGTTATILAPFEADLSAVKINLQAGWANISQVDGFGVISVDNKGKIWWEGSLEGKDGKVEVSSLGGSTQEYTITVERSAKLSDNELTSFAVGDFSGVITGTNIALKVPSALDLVTATPEFESSDLSTVLVGATEQTSGTSVQDLSSGATYTVKAQDGTTEDYTLTVTTVDTELTSFSFAALNPVISGVLTGNDIAVSVITGTDLTALVPTFEVSEFSTVKVGTTAIVSGVTAVDFSAGPVTFTLTTKAGDSVDYTVTITEL